MATTISDHQLYWHLGDRCGLCAGAGAPAADQAFRYGSGALDRDEGLLQRLRERRTQDAAFGDDASDVAERRHVEGGVADVGADRGHLRRTEVAHFALIALLDRD